MASIAKEPEAEVIDLGSIGTRQGDMDQLLRNRPSQATQLLFVYEAGPWGSWLSRSLTKNGYDGWVVAPSLIPRNPGDRGKTDRRDAVPLAGLARSGELTAVDVPKVDDEALRDRPRAREATIRALQSAKCRLKAFWLRHHSRSTGRATGGPAHLRWLSAGVCPTPTPHIVSQAYGRAVSAHPARLQRLEQARQDQVQAWRLQPVVEALQALRGVQFTVAVTLVANSVT